MVEKRELYERFAEVQHIVKWWMTKSRSRYARCLHNGDRTHKQFIADVWIRCVSSFGKREALAHSFCCHVIHAATWEMNRYVTHGERPLSECEHRGRAKRLTLWTDRTAEEGEHLTHVLSKARQVLDSRCYSILWHWLGVGKRPMSGAEIGVMLGISATRVHQLLHAIGRRLSKRRIIAFDHSCCSSRPKGVYAELLINHLEELQ